MNLRIFIPFATMRQYFPPKDVGETVDAISFINYQPQTRDMHQAAQIEVHKIIGRNHGFDYSNPDAFDEWDSIRTADQVGKDRTREIGLRKAIGATNRSIMFQFFVEGAFLTLLSGGIGMGFAAALMAALSLLPSPPGWDTPKLVPSTAALAIGSLALAGVAAGLYPARKAAMLQPVEALRKE